VKALLQGGPVEGRVIPDVTEETENISIPAASMKNPRAAIYTRAGDMRDGAGEKILLFNFVKIQLQKWEPGRTN
jgi:hypothetical protein